MHRKTKVVQNSACNCFLQKLVTSMTTDLALLSKIIALPTDLKTEVELFIDYLIYTKKIQKDKIKKTPVAGFGTINYITTPDFDEPLGDFKM
ncbi:MAG: DUF2281 domain-containing protein [Sphingobacteriales bacterium]|nr:DUF2281 domain-containing protein [Sphingobacteriales bacterium]